MIRVRVLLALVAAFVLLGGAVSARAAANHEVTSPVEEQNVVWLDHVASPSSVTGLAIIPYPDGDVLFGDGPSGLMAWSLADPVHPSLVGQIPAPALAHPGDDPTKRFWEGEHLQVDPARRLVFLTRDPRSFGGTLQTGKSGIYVIDARDPRHLRLLAFDSEPGGHTSQCIARCQYLWSGGPLHTATGVQPADWRGQPAWVTDMRDPSRPSTLPDPVDLHRDDGVTGYVHDSDVDANGVAWTSGTGGVRGYWTEGMHYDPVQRRTRPASPTDPVPYAGGKIVSPNDPSYTFDHNSWHPLDAIGGFGPGELLFVTDEDFGSTCADAGRLLVVSLRGSFQGQGWFSTPAHPFRLQVVGEWGPTGNPGLQRSVECSAHWFQHMDGVGDDHILVQAFYGQGTRFIDYSDPRHPRQVGYFAPQRSIAATPLYHDGFVYAAQYSGGIDVIRFTPP